MEKKKQKFSGWTIFYFILLLLYPVMTTLNLYQLFDGTTLDEFSYLPLAIYYIIFTLMYIFLAVFAYYTLYQMFKRKKNAHILNYKFIMITAVLSIISIFIPLILGFEVFLEVLKDMALAAGKKIFVALLWFVYFFNKAEKY